jgi:mannose-6-phosphate isomerase-like protein (cupin superfamily)
MPIMPDHTLVNLIGDVQDMAPQFGMEGIQARFARTNLELEKSGLSSFVLEPDVQLPFGHRHAEQEEIYVVLEGGGTCAFEEGEVELGPMDALRVAPQVARSFRAGPEGARLLAFGAPNTQGKDAEMIGDFWERRG